MIWTTLAEGGLVRNVAIIFVANSVTALSSITAEMESHFHAAWTISRYASISEPTLKRHPAEIERGGVQQ